MSILVYHHIIPQQFGGHDAFRGIDARILGIDSVANGIYLPADYRLAKAMGISPHPGGHPESYYKTVKCVLDQITKIPEPDIRAVKIRALMDAMRIGFNKGELYTNVPIGGTPEEVEQGVKRIVKQNEVYLKENPDSLQDIRDREQRGLETGHEHLLAWSAIQGHPRREEALDREVEHDTSKITSGNKNLGGTKYSKFMPVDDVFHVPPSTPLNPGDVPSVPPFFPPFFQWLNQPEGFTRSDPRFTGALPAFPTSNPDEQRLGQLPPSTATLADPLVLKFDPATGAPLPFHDNPLMRDASAGSSTLVQDALPWLAGGAALGLAAPVVSGSLAAALAFLVAMTQAAKSKESNSGAAKDSVANGGVFSTGAPAYDTFINGATAGNADGGLGSGSSVHAPPGIGSAPLGRDEMRGDTFADRFGNWTNTPNGVRPADETPGVFSIAPVSAAAAPEEVRRLTRSNASNAGSVFTSGSAPIPYLPPADFNNRYVNWRTSIGENPQQASKPSDAFKDEPSYFIPPPIFGTDPGGPRSEADEWFSRWIGPFVR